MMSGSAPANPGVDEADDVDYVISKCKRGLRGSTISLQLRGVLNAGVLLRGLYVFPLIDNLEEWRGILFVHKGIYKGAIFKFSLHFPDDYPDQLPVLRFRSEIQHPLIDKDGYFNLEQMPEPEDASQTTVLSLLNYMKSTFTIGGLEIIKADKCSNPVAYETFRNNRALFENNAAFSALKSASSADLYTNDADDPLKMIKVKDETQFLKARADLLEKLLGIFQ